MFVAEQDMTRYQAASCWCLVGCESNELQLTGWTMLVLHVDGWYSVAVLRCHHT